MNQDLVARALALAIKWHEGQLRYDCSKYITHPIAVEKTLSKHGYNDVVTKCLALLHDSIEMTKPFSLAQARMKQIYEEFGREIGNGIFVLSENMGDVGESFVVKTEEYKIRLINSGEKVQRVKVVDFLENSRDIYIYKPISRIRRINEAYSFYIPLGFNLAPTIGQELIEVIEYAKKYYI